MAVQAAGISACPSEELVRFGREVIRRELAALAAVAERIDDQFAHAATLIYHCRGCVLVCGMGKAGLVGQKIAATLASLGTRSYFLHPAEALHGDLGRVHRDDAVIVLSYSGETEEIVAFCRLVRAMHVPLVAITKRSSCTVGRLADVVITLGLLEEACPLGLAPTSSTTAMLAVGDALALTVARLRGFTAEDFARFHPGGSLGRKLALVEEFMRPLDQCRVAHQGQTVREVLIHTGRPGRRTGAIMLVDDEGRLTGIFTDSDLARLFERRADEKLDRPIAEVMTRRPITIATGSRLHEAVALMAERKISELPVVDAEGRPLGLVDVTDVVALWPEYFPQGDSPCRRPHLTVCRPPVDTEKPVDH